MRPQVVEELGRGTHEGRVVVGVGVVLAEDEALEVVHVRVEAVRPSSRRRCRARRRRGAAGGPAACRAGANPRSGHLADEATLVADDRGREAELGGEPHRARHHAARDERDRDAPGHRRADRGPGPRPDDQVVADERPVDVEGDQADRERGLARGPVRHVQMMTDPRRCRPAGSPGRPTIATRGRPARSGWTVHVQPGRTLATRSTIASPWSAPISRKAEPSVARASGRRSRSRAMTAEPVRPAIERERRLERRGDGQAGHRVTPDVRQVGEDRCVNGSATTGGRRSASHEPELVGDGVADGVLAGEVQGVRSETSVARTRELLVGTTAPQGHDEGDGDGAAAGPDVGDPDRRARRRAGAEAVSRRMTSSWAASTSASVSGRGMRARAVDDEREAVELLDPADVGDRLARRPPLDGGRGSAPRHPRRPARRDGPRWRSGPRPTANREQELGVQARRFGSGGAQPCRRPRCSSSPVVATSGRDRRPRSSVERRSAWSAIWRASIRWSRSPSMTLGRLCTVSPIRWSVTRSCGKL